MPCFDGLGEGPNGSALPVRALQCCSGAGESDYESRFQTEQVTAHLVASSSPCPPASAFLVQAREEVLPRPSVQQPYKSFSDASEPTQEKNSLTRATQQK